MVFGRVWEGFWEAQILDFCIFFDVFAKHFSNNVLEGQKIENKSPQRERRKIFGSALRNARPAGEGNGRGSEASRTRIV